MFDRRALPFLCFLEDDVAPFLEHFDACVASHTEMATFARLRGKANGDARWPVFELRGHPHYDQDQCACFFVMARPYPSRNTAMYVFLLSFLYACTTVC